MWPEVGLVHGKPSQSQSQGSVERANQDVENMVSSWLHDNKPFTWTKGLSFVQLMKNQAYHSGIQSTPYEAMFRITARIGLASSIILVSVLAKKVFRTEEEVEEVCASVSTIQDEQEDDEYCAPSDAVIVDERTRFIERHREVAKDALYEQAAKMVKLFKDRYTDLLKLVKQFVFQYLTLTKLVETCEIYWASFLVPVTDYIRLELIWTH